MKKKTVLLRGPLLTKSGYGVHSRQVARWLFGYQNKIDISCELLPWGVTPWFTDVEACDGLIGEMLESSKNTKQFYDVSIQIQLPNEWNPFAGQYNVGITAGVETDKCNPAWIDCINRMQLVIVPSEFVKQTFLASGQVKTPIVVVPESFSDVYFNDSFTKLDLTQLQTKFNFLVVGQLTGNNPENDRKAILYTMKWFSEAFTGNPDVGLVIKTSLFRQTHLDKALVTNLFTKTLVENGLVKKNGPKFYLLHGDMTDEEMYALYKHPSIKALVSFTHGEGFGLPLLEAAVSELPVIATNWSAHTEFLPSKQWLPISCKIDTIHPTRVDNGIFMQGAKWAVCEEQSAKERMKTFYDKPNKPQEWGKKNREVLIKSHCFEQVKHCYDLSPLGQQMLGSV